MQKIIGLVGPIASGKGTVANFLQERGFTYYSLSDIIREKIRKNNLPVNRENLQAFGNKLRQDFGNDVLAQKTAEKIDKDFPEKIVIDSIRNPKEIEYLKNKYDIFILAVTADQKTRYEMMLARGRENEKISFEKFKKVDDKELESKEAHTQLVNQTLKLADEIIENNGTVEELNDKVSSTLAKKANFLES